MQKTSPKKARPQLSGLCAEDLGLKAGFMKDKSSDITFRPILGWALVMNYAEISSRAMTPLVLDEHSFPTLVSKANFPDFVGVFEKSVNAADAKKKQNDRPLE
jgi:hypothetical protein